MDGRIADDSNQPRPLKSVEMFAGAGGLALGASGAGFHHTVLLEINGDVCDTIRANMNSGRNYSAGWPLVEGDVRDYDFNGIEDVDLLAAGVPCQPFSAGGKKRGQDDERNMFPELFRAQRELKPQVVLVENVRGLAAQSFSKYFEYIRLCLQFPLLERLADEDWGEHRNRLLQVHAAGELQALEYVVSHAVLNAADFGAAQWRERVFIVAIRSDLESVWVAPQPTHSMDRLVWDQWKSGDYWKRHKIAKPPAPDMSHRYGAAIRRVLKMKSPPAGKPWRTIRDEIAALPEVAPGVPHPDDSNHFINPGARAYDRHTGSRIDEPAKTLKAGAHGVPGGENTLEVASGVRYFSVREAAILQGFPKDYRFEGAWTSAMRQIGNAVPVHLAKAVADSIRTILESSGRA